MKVAAFCLFQSYLGHSIQLCYPQCASTSPSYGHGE